jgi:hypothetical protein
MREIMDPLPLPDLHHLRAASGWLELGSHLEANEGLERISPRDTRKVAAERKF